MESSTDGSPNPSLDFAKYWQETFLRMLQAAGTFTPESMPPDMLRQLRSGILQALAKSWEEFMRSPQFLEGMKQMMDNAIAFRRLTGDFLARARQETQGTTRQDVDDTLLALREMEARLNRRIDELAARIATEPRRRTSRPRPAGRDTPRGKPSGKRTSRSRRSP